MRKAADIAPARRIAGSVVLPVGSTRLPQISDIGHHAVPIAEHLIPAFAGDEAAPSGIVVNTQSRKSQRMLGIPDVIHLHHLTTRVCGFLPEAPA